MNNVSAVYVHIPFCVKKCPYCSFAVAVNQNNRQEEYLTALEKEAGRYSGKISTLYIGGGTPSCLSSSGIERLMSILKRSFDFRPGAEITIEVNPESISPDKARILKVAGVNRVSMGVQSLNNGILELLGRPHRRQDVLDAFNLLRSAGFDNINLDFIYGLPGQAVSEVINDLEQLLLLGSEHCSLYALNVEPKSLFYARRMEVDQDAQGELYAGMVRRMAAAGVIQYEVSNFARPGYESRHNINTWEGGEYIGLGMAAHSHAAGERFWNADTLPDYLTRMRESGSARTGGERLPAEDKLTEVFLFGLRMNKGVDLEELEKKAGVRLSDAKKEMIESFIEMRLLKEYNGRVCATPRGVLLLDEISARII